MSIAKNIENKLSKASWIRKMFEEGARLKALHGAEKVYDFSLGNLTWNPPKFPDGTETNRNVIRRFGSGYMPNSGYPHVRKSVADYLSVEQRVSISEKEIVMTCGAAGAMNVILKTLLDRKTKSLRRHLTLSNIIFMPKTTVEN
jgi:aspartate aminotransferase